MALWEWNKWRTFAANIIWFPSTNAETGDRNDRCQSGKCNIKCVQIGFLIVQQLLKEVFNLKCGTILWLIVLIISQDGSQKIAEEQCKSTFLISRNPYPLQIRIIIWQSSLAYSWCKVGQFGELHNRCDTAYLDSSS